MLTSPPFDTRRANSPHGAGCTPAQRWSRTTPASSSHSNPAPTLVRTTNGYTSTTTAPDLSISRPLTDVYKIVLSSPAAHPRSASAAATAATSASISSGPVTAKRLLRSVTDCVPVTSTVTIRLPIAGSSSGMGGGNTCCTSKGLPAAVGAPKKPPLPRIIGGGLFDGTKSSNGGTCDG